MLHRIHPEIGCVFERARLSVEASPKLGIFLLNKKRKFGSDFILMLLVPLFWSRAFSAAPPHFRLVAATGFVATKHVSAEVPSVKKSTPANYEVSTKTPLVKAAPRPVQL